MDEKTTLFTFTVFAVGAVALIMYQHAMHTQEIINAGTRGVGDTPGINPGVGENVYQGGPIYNASLAGQTTPGQINLVPVPAVTPVEIWPGYTAGPNGSGGAFGIQPSSFMYQ
jgi:hypothetical protein